MPQQPLPAPLYALLEATSLYGFALADAAQRGLASPANPHTLKEVLISRIVNLQKKATLALAALGATPEGAKIEGCTPDQGNSGFYAGGMSGAIRVGTLQQGDQVIDPLGAPCMFLGLHDEDKSYGLFRYGDNGPIRAWETPTVQFLAPAKFDDTLDGFSFRTHPNPMIQAILEAIPPLIRGWPGLVVEDDPLVRGTEIVTPGCIIPQEIIERLGNAFRAHIRTVWSPQARVARIRFYADAGKKMNYATWDL